MIPLPLIAQITSPDGSEMSFGWLFVKTILAMIVVIALAILFIRFVVPRLQVGKGGRPSRIRVLEKINIEPRKSLLIVRAGKKTALIGVSEQSIGKLLDLDEADLDQQGD